MWPDFSGTFGSAFGPSFNPFDFLNSGATGAVEPFGASLAGPELAMAPAAPTAAPMTPPGVMSTSPHEATATAEATGDTTGATGSSKTDGSFGGKLQSALSGVKAPAAPTPQTVRSPEAPKPVAYSQNERVLQLLAALGLQGGGGKNPTGLQLPSTLGQALSGR